MKTEAFTVKQDSADGETVAASIKAEAIEEVLPAKRKRKQVSCSASPSKRNRASVQTVQTKTEAEAAYPTPPETPQLQVKVEQIEYFAAGSAFRLVERVKRTRRTSKAK